MMLSRSTRISAVALCFISRFVGADRMCNIGRFPGCSAPFPPGHKNIGDAWWGIGSKESGAIIKSVTTILLVNEVPKMSQGVMVINSALENSDRHDESDRVPMLETYQTLTVSYPLGWNACDQQDNQWCIFPSLYNRHSDPEQYSAAARALDPLTAARLNWNYNGADRIELDTIGTGISNLTIEAPWQWWPKTECQCGAKGVIPAHSYVQTEITLMNPVANWGSTADFQKASASVPTSDDGGLTWKIDSIDIEDSYCESDTQCPSLTKRALSGERLRQPIWF